MAQPAEGTLRFDREPTHARPTGRTTIAQWRDDEAVKASAYRWQPDDIVACDVAAPRWPAAVSRPTSTSVPLLIARPALLAGAGVSCALAYDAHQRWEDPATTTGELDQLRELNNGLFVTSIVAGAAGIGGGVPAFVVGSF